MISFLIHTPDGQILCRGNAINEAVVLVDIAGTVNSVVFDPPTDIRPSQHYFDGINYIEIPQRPGSEHVFNYAIKTWEDPRSLTELRVAKNSQINTWRLEANQSSFIFDGHEIACDSLSRSDIDAVNGEVSLTSTLPSNWPGVWKAKDNTYVTIPDVATWTAFYQAMTAQGTANFLHAQTLKAQVVSATTIEEVDSIVW